MQSKPGDVLHLPTCPSARLPVCPSARLPVCPSARLPVCPSARLPVCPSARLATLYWAVVERAVIVYNRFARNAPPMDRVQSAVDAIGKAWQIDIRVTDAPGHATQLARDAATSGATAVFAYGGDGTVNEVVNGLAGSDCALGVLRGGMGNVFAKEIGIQRRPDRALRQQLNGDRQRFDLGKVNDRHFLLMAGVGLDAAVVRAVPDSLKRRLGSTSYALWALKLLPGYRPTPTHLSIDGAARDTELFWLLLGNTRSYGGFINITSKARVDDGLLDAYIFEGHRLAWKLTTALKLALKRQDGAKGVAFHRLHDLSIEAPGLPIQADGEYLGQTPATFSVEPHALDVLLPAGRGAQLFGA
jgi:YegS/Rv2252/BmrU family lipid kinase